MAQTKAQLVDISTTGISAGSASTPGITFTGDLNTGIYSPGADQVAISTNGTGRLFVNSSGSVGIGTSDVQEQLHVEATNGNGIRLSRNSLADNEASDIDFTYRSGATYYWVGKLRSIKRSGGGGDFQFCTSSDGNTEPTTPAVVIDKQGRVGIGSTAPNAKLVVSNGGANGIEFYPESPANTNTIVSYNRSTSLYRALRFEGSDYSFTNGSTAFVNIDSSGRLLVGTSTPLGNSDAQTSFIQNFGNSGGNFQGGRINIGRAEFSANITAGEQLGGIYFSDAQSGTYGVIECVADGTGGSNDYPGRLVFSTTSDGASSPTERMRITQGGRVFVGKTAPGLGVFHVANQPGVFAALALSSTSASDTVAQFVSGTNADGSGGTQVGSINITSTATAYITSSDYRLKENVTAVTDGITRLQQLKPCTFNFIIEPDRTVDGFLAHEVQTVVPEAITGEKDAVDDDGNPIYQGIDQSKLVPLLTAALQEAIGEIESLKARVAALESA